MLKMADLVGYSGYNGYDMHDLIAEKIRSHMISEVLLFLIRNNTIQPGSWNETYLNGRKEKTLEKSLDMDSDLASSQEMEGNTV